MVYFASPEVRVHFVLSQEMSRGLSRTCFRDSCFVGHAAGYSFGAQEV